MKIIKDCILILGLFGFTNMVMACPAPVGNTPPYGLTELRGGIYRVYFCQNPSPETQSYSLTAGDIGNLAQIGGGVGKAFADTNNHTGTLPITNTINMNGTIDVSGLQLNNNSVTLESNSFNFYSRRNRGRCEPKWWEFRRSEYEYIVGYLKGISVNGSPSSPSTGQTFSAVAPGDTTTFQAVRVGNNVNSNPGQVIARITNVELKHMPSGEKIMGNIEFVIRDNQQYRLRRNVRVCRVGINTRLTINPAGSFLSISNPTANSPGDYQIKVQVSKP